MHAPDNAAALAARLAEAETRGQQCLLYTPAGVLGGSFSCPRCRAVAFQPDLLVHAPDCPYHPEAGPITVW